jgi:thiamine transport system substrate-binding protein
METHMKTLLLAVGATMLAPMAKAETPILNVLTYDSFATEWGPGPAIEAGFEAVCACDLQFQTAGDGAALLARLQLDGAGSDADVVVGLDTNLVSKAQQTGLFAPVPPAETQLPTVFSSANFVPFDWGWFAFVYNKTKLATPPKSFPELAASDVKIIIQDPRSSTPGLGLLLWVKAAYGEKSAQIWADLADNIVTVTPGWSEAYGLFLQGEADMVLSYTTSPAYHMIAEGDDTKAAAPFDEGHYLQIEVAGVLAASDQPALAQRFMDYLLQPAAQAALITTNWMYPATAPEGGLPAEFDTLIAPTATLILAPDQVEEVRQKAIVEWQDILSR